MKLTVTLTAAVLAFAASSCNSNYTQYNGFVKNTTSSAININVESKHSIADTFHINSGEIIKITSFNEKGDFEIYDCTSFFDSISYQFSQTIITVLPEDTIIGSTSKLSSDGTRTHDCILEIRDEGL
tara:strand:- start:201 stop:581 length:381 start_codon:yes stop_codon:yes gene_type:complete